MTDRIFDNTCSVRPCRSDDLDAMREICIETSSLPMKNEKDVRFLLLMYCDPYVEYTDDCFVAVDEDDRPVGYVLCAADTREYLRQFRKNVLPEISKLGFIYAIKARFETAGQAMFRAFAPAHLHIDLTASARRKGIGTALIKTLKKHLAQKGVEHVQLTCGSKNKVAISFYKRNGFKTLFKFFGACVMRAKTE